MDNDDDFFEKLIDLVYKNKCLWDKRGEGRSKDDKMKRHCWISIGETCNKSANYCKSKWTYLRDHYVKEKKKLMKPGSSAKQKSSSDWKFFWALTFLDEVIKPRNTEYNFSSSADDTVKYCSKLDKISADIQSQSSQEPEDDIGSPISAPSSASVSRKRKIDHIDKASIQHLSKFEDEDELYGRSIGKSMKRFPPLIKSQLKIDIMVAMHKADQEMLEQSKGP